jgi:hypothetical protein
MWVTYSSELGSNKMYKTTLGSLAKWAIPFNICTPLSKIGIRLFRPSRFAPKALDVKVVFVRIPQNLLDIR